MGRLNLKCVRSADLFHLQPISGGQSWCFISTFSCPD